MLIQRCCPRLHAILYKYFGENTVQMNRCVLNAVHASITDDMLLAVKNVWSDKCCTQSPNCVRGCSDNSIDVAEVHHKGPAQLEQNVSKPTAATL